MSLHVAFVVLGVGLIARDLMAPNFRNVLRAIAWAVVACGVNARTCSAILVVTDVQTFVTTFNTADNDSNARPSRNSEREDHIEQVELTVFAPFGSTHAKSFGSANYEVQPINQSFRLYGSAVAEDSTSGADPAPRTSTDLRIFFDVFFTLIETTQLTTTGLISYEVAPGGSTIAGLGDGVSFGLEFDGGPYDVRGFTLAPETTQVISSPTVTLGPGNHSFRAGISAVATSRLAGEISLSELNYDFTISVAAVPESSVFWLASGSCFSARAESVSVGVREYTYPSPPSSGCIQIGFGGTRVQLYRTSCPCESRPRVTSFV